VVLHFFVDVLVRAFYFFQNTRRGELEILETILTGAGNIIEPGRQRKSEGQKSEGNYFMQTEAQAQKPYPHAKIFHPPAVDDVCERNASETFKHLFD
jgi:hypothetical protein